MELDSAWANGPIGDFYTSIHHHSTPLCPVPLQRMQLGVTIGFGVLSLMYVIIMYVVILPSWSQKVLGLNQLILLEVLLRKGEFDNVKQGYGGKKWVGESIFNPFSHQGDNVQKLERKQGKLIQLFNCIYNIKLSIVYNIIFYIKVRQHHIPKFLE